MSDRKIHMRPRVRQVNKKNNHKAWDYMELGNGTTVYYRVLDEEIISKMPIATQTIMEQGFLRPFVKRMRKFIKTGR